MAIDLSAGSGSECLMRNREKDIDKDAARLDKALEHVLGIFDQEVPPELTDPDDVAVLKVAISKTKLEACKALVPLLERRAALLGLDAPVQKPSDGANQSGTLAELERKLALVPPGKAS